MTFLVRLTILVLLLLLLFPKIVKSAKLFSIGDEHVPFIIDICKLYKTKSTIFLFAESIQGTIIFLIFFSSFLLSVFLFSLRYGKDNNGVQMDACPFSRRVYHFEFLLFTIGRIIVLYRQNLTTALHRSYI